MWVSMTRFTRTLASYLKSSINDAFWCWTFHLPLFRSFERWLLAILCKVHTYSISSVTNLGKTNAIIQCMVWKRYCVITILFLNISTQHWIHSEPLIRASNRKIFTQKWMRWNGNNSSWCFNFIQISNTNSYKLLLLLAICGWFCCGGWRILSMYISFVF